MDYKTVTEFSESLFQKYSTEEPMKDKFLFAKALQNNSRFYDDVKADFFDQVNHICRLENHHIQKCSFRKVLLTNIKNMIMWQEYFKKNAPGEGRLIYSFLQDSTKNTSFENFEKQSAYFQLYSEALYSLFQCVLNRFYDQIIENSYSVILLTVFRLYYQKMFESILCHQRGEIFEEMDELLQLKELIEKIEEPALKGDERAYDPPT